MNGMKSIFLTLAMIVGVALAVPASPSRRDVSALAPQEPAPKVEAPEVPATVEEAPQAESKPAVNATARPVAASKPEVMKSAEGKVEEVTFELPLSDESLPEMVYEARDPAVEEFVAAAKPEQFAEEMQGDEAAPNAFEANQETQSNTGAKAEEDVKETKETKEAKELVKAAEDKKVEEGKSLEEAKAAEAAEEAEEAENAEEPEEDEEEKDVILVAEVAETAGKGEEAERANKTEERENVEEVKQVEEAKQTKQAEEVKEVKEAKEAEKVEGKKEPESDGALEEELLQAPSADYQREKMIDDMIEKLKKLKGSPQAN